MSTKISQSIKSSSGIISNVKNWLRFQFSDPRFSLSSSIATRLWSRGSTPIVRAVIDKLDIKPYHNILELGYGRGNGLALVCKRLQNGEVKDMKTGMVFGIETSEYMEKVAIRRFILEIQAQNLMVLSRTRSLMNLPYPNDHFDSIYHVDVFYLWPLRQIFGYCTEFLRVLKPGGRIVCGMELNRLRKLEKWDIVKASEYDPMKYTTWLEPAGFTDVKIEYQKIGNREVQLISARKPDAASTEQDPEVVMKQLEEDIKQFMFLQSLAESKPMDKSTREQFSDAVNEHIKDDSVRIEKPVDYSPRK